MLRRKTRQEGKTESGAGGGLGGVAGNASLLLAVTFEQRPGIGEGVRCTHTGKEQAD